jgi:hypothetical protein
MPKASINEHTNPGGTEDDVGFAPDIILWSCMKPVPQARLVQGAAKHGFGIRVF